MSLLYAQGDLLIERVGDIPVSGTPVEPGADGAVVLLEGELTGHRHAIFDIDNTNHSGHIGRALKARGRRCRRPPSRPTPVGGHRRRSSVRP
jgi:hypothetical protein